MVAVKGMTNYSLVSAFFEYSSVKIDAGQILLLILKEGRILFL